MSAPDELLTVGEVAALLKIGKTTVREIVRCGRLEAFQLGATKAGGVLRISKRSVVAYLEERRVPVPLNERKRHEQWRGVAEC